MPISRRAVALSKVGRAGVRPEGPQGHAGAAAGSDGPFDVEFARLYHESFASLFRYLDRLTGDAELAADVVQETFVRLFRRRAMPEEPRAWLVTVAHNLLRDDRRRASRRSRLLRAAGRAPSTPAATPDPAAAVDARDQRARVRAALERLAPRDRQALLLRHSGYSYREIAGVLGLAEASVGTILLRAGAAFRNAFREMHGAPD